MGIYIHWPFCLSKCPYCDFNIYLLNDQDDKRWIDAYLKSIKTYAALMPRRDVISLYFGGGTPSLMKPDDVAAIIETVRENFNLAKDAEITLEANPTSTEIKKFRDFRAAGVNRISIGVQSLRDDVLKFLGRLHGADDVRRAIDIARSVFERMTFDLIYALPDQTLSDWERDLKAAIPLMQGHLSAYQLNINEGTAFAAKAARGELILPLDDRAADFYKLTGDIMADAGMPGYEISNYGAAGQESRHNMIYWRYDDYIGIGPGAHGRITLDGRKHATLDHKTPSEWLKLVEMQGHGTPEMEPLGSADYFTEKLLMGLRIRDGVDLDNLSVETNLAWRDMIHENQIAIIQSEGWAEFVGQTLRLTPEGWLRADGIAQVLLK
jgi:oxygen-independent coproporphyrinogen-3 oxidase